MPVLLIGKSNANGTEIYFQLPNQNNRSKHILSLTSLIIPATDILPTYLTLET
jgi:hypothetical protein